MSLKILIGLLAAVLVTSAGVVATYGNPFSSDLGPSPCSQKSAASAMPCSEGDSCCVLTGVPSCCDAGVEAESNDAAIALMGGSMAVCELNESNAE